MDANQLWPGGIRLLLSRPSGTFPMIKPRSLPAHSRVDQVTSAIRQSILNGELKPGSPFKTNELAAALGVSIIPVREGLQRLSVQGLVELRPAKTAVVTALNGEDLVEIYQLRSLIEGDAAERACLDLTVADISTMETTLKAMEGSLPTDEDFWERHALFHKTLLRPRLTPRLESTLEPLWQGAQRYVRLIYDEVGFSDHGAPEEIHRPILEAGKKGDPAGLREALEEHYEGNLKWMLGGLAQTPLSAAVES